MLAITGSTGFIGKAVSPLLPFPQKRLVSRLPDHACPDRNCRYILGDLSHSSALEEFIKGTSVLLHLACASNPRNSNHAFQENLAQDFLPTLHLFELYAKENPNGHIIFTSSGGNMYHTGFPFIPRTELDLPIPNSGYSIQKLSIEHYLRLLTKLYGVKVTVLRISNPYGVLLSPERGNGLIGIAMNKLIYDEPLIIVDSLLSVRDYLHLNDLIEAFKLVLFHPPVEGEFRLFNLSSGLGYSLEDVLKLIEKITERSFKKQFQVSASTLSPSWSVLSYDLFNKVMGWSPKIPLREGIEKMWSDAESLMKIG